MNTNLKELLRLNCEIVTVAARASCPCASLFDSHGWDARATIRILSAAEVL